MDDDEPGSSVPAVEKSTMKTLFLGGGAYCFQRHMQFAYPRNRRRRRRDRPRRDQGQFHGHRPPRNTPIKTYWGDARQFVELNQDSKQYDLIFGDAFNDFSVPWHLTTREFNEKIKKMLTPNGVYMINIIDVYETDAARRDGGPEEDRRRQDHRRRTQQDKIRKQRWPRPAITAASSGPGPRPPGSLSQHLYLRHRQHARIGLARNVRGRRLDEAARPERPGEPRG